MRFRTHFFPSAIPPATQLRFVVRSEESESFLETTSFSVLLTTTLYVVVRVFFDSDGNDDLSDERKLVDMRFLSRMVSLVDVVVFVGVCFSGHVLSYIFSQSTDGEAGTFMAGVFSYDSLNQQFRPFDLSRRRRR